MRAVPCIGYELLSEREQLVWCSRNRQRRAGRQLTRGINEIVHLPPENLSVHEQRVRMLAIQNMRTERKLIRAMQRGEQMQIKVTETPAKRPERMPKVE